MASDRNSRYEERMYLHEGETEISDKSYNLIIGGTLLYGFLINVFLVYFCYDSCSSFIESNPIVFYIAYIAMILVGTFMIHGSKNPVFSFIGYNLMVLPLGICLSYIINAYNIAGFSGLVTTAFGITAGVTFIMMFLSSLVPEFFLSLGKTLGICLIITVVLEIILTLLGASLGIFDYIVVLIFCGYVGYDWARANACVKTVDNAIDSAAELYIDIVNLFLRILRILARSEN